MASTTDFLYPARRTVAAALTAALLLAACGWAEADRGRNTDHDPPPGEDGSAPAELEDPAADPG